MSTDPSVCQHCGSPWLEPRFGALFCCDCDRQWHGSGISKAAVSPTVLLDVAQARCLLEAVPQAVVEVEKLIHFCDLLRRNEFGLSKILIVERRPDIPRQLGDGVHRCCAVVATQIPLAVRIARISN